MNRNWKLLLSKSYILLYSSSWLLDIYFLEICISPLTLFRIVIFEAAYRWGAEKMSAKMATPDLLKITVFWDKSYNVIIHVDDVTDKILSRDSNYIVDVFMWPKFGNYSISMREAITISIILGFDQKIRSFKGWFWFKFNNLRLARGANLNLTPVQQKG